MLLLLLPGLLPAQTAQFPWAVSAGGGVARYLSHPGMPNTGSTAFFPGTEVAVTKYLNGAFDLRTALAFGPRVQYPGWGDALVSGHYLDMSYQLRFKVNNGLFLRESAFLGPYAILGVGGSYVPGHPDAYVPLGGGIRFRLHPRASVQVETVRKLSLNKDQQQLAHAIAFVYNLNTEPQPALPEEEMTEEQLLAALIPADQDGDGLVDQLDACPDLAGPLALDGCPEAEPLTEIALLDTVAPTADPEWVAEATPEPQPEPLPEPEPELPAWEPEPQPQVAFVEPEPEPIPLQPEPIAEPEPALVLDTPDPFRPAQPEPTPAPAVALEMPTEQPQEAEESWMEVVEEPLPVQEEPAEVAEAESETPWQAPEPPALPVQPVRESLPCGQGYEAPKPAPVLFAYASDQLDPAAKDQLAQLAEMLKSCKQAQLVLEGHTDDIGAENDNLVLSIMRAYNVKYYLVYEHGISQSRILSKGLGEKQPQVANTTSDARHMNRRVDFTLVL